MREVSQLYFAVENNEENFSSRGGIKARGNEPSSRHRRVERGINYGDMPKVSRARSANATRDDDDDFADPVVRNSISSV